MREMLRLDDMDDMDILHEFCIGAVGGRTYQNEGAMLLGDNRCRGPLHGMCL